MVPKVLGMVSVLALLITVVTASITGSIQVLAANSTKAAGAANATTAANSTKAAGAANATSGNPITQLGQAISNGLKGLGNLLTGNKK